MNPLRHLATAALAALVLTTLAVPHARAVTIDWVTVGDPGNTADTTGDPNPAGAVPESFRIMKFEFTNSQYTDFLNSVAATDTYSLYNTRMGSYVIGGITRSGASGSYTYAVRANMGDKPVNFVSWFDAARVANWLMNGATGTSSTETGAYTLGGATTGDAPAVNSGATFYIPTEDQWYKAAYYKGGSTNAGYWDYATQSDTAPTAVTSGSTGIGSAGSTSNFANYDYGAEWNGLTGNVTTVGTNGVASAYGAFDMGGNVREWNDRSGAAGSVRGLRGGYVTGNSFDVSSSSGYGTTPSFEHAYNGFRLASPVAVPEPSTYAMALAGLSCGGFSMWRRRRRGCSCRTRQISKPGESVFWSGSHFSFRVHCANREAPRPRSGTYFLVAGVPAMTASITYARVLTCVVMAVALAAGTVIPAHAEISFTNYTKDNGLGGNYVMGVYASGGSIYAATYSFGHYGGVSISTNGGANWTNYTKDNGLGENDVYGVYASGGTIYAATNGGGLSISTSGGTNWTNYTTENGLASNYVYGVYATGSMIYAATMSGLSVSANSGASWANYNYWSGLGAAGVHGVYASGSTIYAATTSYSWEPGGLSISTNNGASWTNYTTANGLGSNAVSGVYASGSTIYAATQGGLSISTNSGASWTHYTTANGLAGNNVLSVYASGGTIYAATNGGLSISTNGGESWTTYNTDNGLGDNAVSGVYATESTIYAATHGGLSIATVPEPSTYAMALAGLACGGYSVWRRRRLGLTPRA